MDYRTHRFGRSSRVEAPPLMRWGLNVQRVKGGDPYLMTNAVSCLKVTFGTAVC